MPERGFVSRYLVDPWHDGPRTAVIQVGIYAVWLVPTVLAHGARLLRSTDRLTSPVASS